MKTAIAITAATLLSAFAVAPAQAQSVGVDGPQVGDWEATLSGSGSSDNDFDTNAIGLTGSLGKYMMDNVLVGVRQTANFADTKDDNTFTGATRVFADYMFTMGQVQPFIGASLGGIYGEGVNNSFSAGPEVGIKYYPADDTFVYAQTEYQFTFQDTDNLDDSFEDGGWFHGVGVGFNF